MLSTDANSSPALLCNAGLFIDGSQKILSLVLDPPLPVELQPSEARMAQVYAYQLEAVGMLYGSIHQALYT